MPKEEIKKWKVEVDEEACSGCGNCVEIAPKIFKIGKNGLSHVIKDVITIDDLGLAKSAIDSCPNDAISIKEF